MKFSINAYKLLGGLEPTYRLKDDFRWIQQEDFTMVDFQSDMLFDSYEAASEWIQNNSPITIQNEFADKKRASSKLFTNAFGFYIILHRLEKPKTPFFSREQVRDVLLKGDDSHDNALIVDYEGIPRLIDVSAINPLDIKKYVVRYESFQAGNGYVGSVISEDTLKTIYLALLEGWYTHIKTGRTLMYKDYVSGNTTEQDIKKYIYAIVNDIA